MSDPQTPHMLSSTSVISGAEFRHFYQNHWPQDYYVDEFLIDFEDEDGTFILPDDAEVRLDRIGWARWQGKGDCPGAKDIGQIYIETMAANAEQTVLSFAVSKDKAQALITAALALGAKKL